MANLTRAPTPPSFCCSRRGSCAHAHRGLPARAGRRGALPTCAPGASAGGGADPLKVLLARNTAPPRTGCARGGPAARRRGARPRRVQALQRGHRAQCSRGARTAGWSASASPRPLEARRDDDAHRASGGRARWRPRPGRCRMSCVKWNSAASAIPSTCASSAVARTTASPGASRGAQARSRARARSSPGSARCRRCAPPRRRWHAAAAGFQAAPQPTSRTVWPDAAPAPRPRAGGSARTARVRGRRPRPRAMRCQRGLAVRRATTACRGVPARGFVHRPALPRGSWLAQHRRSAAAGGTIAAGTGRTRSTRTFDDHPQPRRRTRRGGARRLRRAHHFTLCGGTSPILVAAKALGISIVDTMTRRPPCSQPTPRHPDRSTGVAAVTPNQPDEHADCAEERAARAKCRRCCSAAGAARLQGAAGTSQRPPRQSRTSSGCVRSNGSPTSVPVEERWRHARRRAPARPSSNAWWTCSTTRADPWLVVPTPPARAERIADRAPALMPEPPRRAHVRRQRRDSRPERMLGAAGHRQTVRAPAEAFGARSSAPAVIGRPGGGRRPRRRRSSLPPSSAWACRSTCRAWRAVSSGAMLGLQMRHARRRRARGRLRAAPPACRATSASTTAGTCAVSATLVAANRSRGRGAEPAPERERDRRRDGRLSSRSPRRSELPRSGGDALAARRPQREAEIDAQAAKRGEHVNLVGFFRAMEQAAGDNAVFVADGGTSSPPRRAHPARARRCRGWTRAFGTLGVGAGFVLGAMARPGAETWLVWGDGAASWPVGVRQLRAPPHPR